MEMNFVLHSEYRTLEYLLWNYANKVENPIAKALEPDPFDINASKVDVKSRNLLMKVNFGNSTEWFLKQSVDEQGNITLKNEKQFYDLISVNHDLKKITSEVIYYDKIYKILVLNSIKNQESLNDVIVRKRKDGEIKEVQAILREIAKAIALVHNEAIKITPLSLIDRFPSSIPLFKSGITTLVPNGIENHDTLNLSSTSFELLFQDYPKKIIEEFNRIWKSTAIIHFDFRADNILVSKDGNAIYIIDWEMASKGDPLWDIVVFMNRVQFFITGIPILNTGEVLEEELKFLYGIFFDEYLKVRNLIKTPDIIEKIRTFWKALYLNNFISTGNSFETEIDELVKNL